MIRTIRSSYHNQIWCCFESVEFLEELRDLLCLVRVDSIRTSGDKRINLVEKEDNWFVFGSLLGSCEKVFDIFGGLVEVGGTKFSHILGDESAPELLGELFGDEGFPSSWGSVEEHPRWDRYLEFLVFGVETLQEDSIFFWLPLDKGGRGIFIGFPS